MLMTVALGAVSVPSAPAAGQVTVTGRVDGQPLGQSSQNRPVKLFPRLDSVLEINVTNGGPDPVEIRKVRLQGQVIGLTFFEYDTSVSMTVAPGSTETRRLAIDLSGLDGQATGLIPGTIKVLDDRRHVLAQQNGVLDVRGSLRSVYGLFGLGVAFLTALSFLGALVGLARHRLPLNRWRRGLRFLTPGLGLGLVVNFTLSATRVFVPEIGRWLTLTALCAAIFFGLGYLTPTPDQEQDEPEAGEVPQTQVIEEITVVAIAGRPPRPALGGQPSRDQPVADGTPYTEVGPAPPAPEVFAEPAVAEPAVPSAPAPPTESPVNPPSPPTVKVAHGPFNPRTTLPAGFSPAVAGPDVERTPDAPSDPVRPAG